MSHFGKNITKSSQTDRKIDGSSNMQNLPKKRYWEFQRLELPFLTTALPRSSLVPPSLLPYFHLVVHCSRRTSISLVPLLAFVILASYFCITLALPTLLRTSTWLCMLFLHKSNRAKSGEAGSDQLEGNISQATKRWIVKLASGLYNNRKLRW